TGEKLVVELERVHKTEDKHSFQGGASVSIFYNQAGEQVGLTGVVARVKDNQMKVVLNSDDLPDGIMSSKLGVDLAYDESTFREMENTIRQVAKAGDNRLGVLRDIIYGLYKPKFDKLEQITFPSLNHDQNEAVRKAIAAKDVALIHGPPGTGKTTTLVQAIKFVADHEKQVLVCTPSNASVDLLVELLTAQGLDVLRIGHPARISEVAVSRSMDARIAAHGSYKELKAVRKKSVELRDMAFKYKRNYGTSERQQRQLLLKEVRSLKDEARMIERYIVQSLLDTTQVVISTLVGANHYLLKSKTFKTLFIDEAGQSLEPACWIPMTKAERVIMAGDHQQLPPTVKSFEAGQRGLDYTLFERLMNNSNADTMLTTQYRMHPDIMTFPSNYFYKGKLVADQGINGRTQLPGSTVEFIDTAGCGFAEQVNPKTLSTSNPEEADLLVKHLGLFLSELNTTSSANDLSIGVIAPYKAQVNLLQDRLKPVADEFGYGDGLSVNTVDSFQGQERDVMYISLTRSNDKGEIGFLKNVRRMNVAVTRAKRKLVVIGDSATLGSDKFYDAMIDYFQSIGAYRSAFEYLYTD
ncbi:MAG: AAA domain-containing protein, partial [Bacteroidota bacterium]